MKSFTYKLEEQSVPRLPGSIGLESQDQYKGVKDKMVSETKLLANRENARLGGVKTEEGKAAIRLNAVAHGLPSREGLLPGKVLEEFRENLMAEYKPEGELETLLVDRIICCAWKLRRALRAERESIREHFADLASKTGLSKIDAVDWCRTISGRNWCTSVWENLNQYETSIERQLYKALHGFQRLKMARPSEKPPSPVAIDIDVSKDS